MKYKVIIFFIVIVWTILKANSFVYLKPIHDELSNEKLNIVVNEIIEISKEKNQNKLSYYIADDHESLYKCNKKTFAECWDLKENSDNAYLWEMLQSALIQGCRKDSNYYICPYYHNQFPTSFDVHDVGLIFGVNVNIRKKPSSKSEILGKYSYLVVRVDRGQKTVKEKINGKEYPWIAIILPNGEKGFLYGKYFVSPLGCRIIFKEYNKQWKISYISCGD